MNRRLRPLAHLLIVLGALLAAAAPVDAQDDGARIAKLNKQALEAYDNLNFEQSRTLLEQALGLIDSAGLANGPVAARTRLNLGMVLMGGFQQRDAAAEQFRLALKIQPELVPPRGVFNPEVQAVFDQTKVALESERKGPAVAQTGGDAEGKDDQEEDPTTAAARAKAKAKAKPRNGAKNGAKTGAADAGEDEETEEEEDATGRPSRASAPLLLTVGIGSGGGITKGRFDTPGFQPDTARGAFAMSGLAHLTVGGGYFLTEQLLLGIDARLQLVGAGTPLCEMGGVRCVESPGFAAAVLARATWFFGSGPLQPFATAGLGGGRIRQVVKIGKLIDEQGAPANSCGTTLDQACVSTVGGGPVWAMAGGGISYEIGTFMLLATAAANVGAPTVMLNFDLTLGLGLRL